MTTTAALDQIDTAFTAITDRPHQPTVPAAVVGTRAPVTICQLRTILRAAGTTRTVRDRIWAHLVDRARNDAHTWPVIAAGLALPGLRHAAARVARICPSEDAADSDAEVLTGFINALADIDTTKPSICSRLCQAAFSAGRSYARRQIRAERTRQRALESRMPPPISGHVDLVLAEAVRDGIITRQDAELIGATRFEGVPLRDATSNHNETLEALHRQRAAAERALTNWILDTPGSDTAAPSTTTEDLGLCFERRPARLAGTPAMITR